MIVGPAGASYTDPETGGDASAASQWAVDVHAGKETYRDFALFLQDEDAGIGTHRMPYTTKVEGPVGINYEATPFTGRRPAQASTPLLRAYADDAVRIHVLVPWSEQAHVFSIENHRWSLEPGTAGASLVSSLQVGALEAVTVSLEGGAGGPAGIPGDYEYGDHRGPYREAGMWGNLQVRCPGELPIRPLDGRRPPAGACGESRGQLARAIGNITILAILVATAVSAVSAVSVVRRRGRRRVS